jgi:enamine deaminase RidA (YjgF/YER057c/UK114 family)
MNIQRNVGIAAHIGAYSDAVEVSTGARWLITSGTPGLSSNGVLPEDFSSQAVLAWENVIRMLDDADMGVQDVVKVTQYLVRRSDLDAYRPIRRQFLGEARPASMLSFVNDLVWPQMLIELEIIAVKSH